MRGLRHKHRAQRTRQSPSNDSQRKDRPSRTPGPQHTEPQRQRRQAPPIRGGLVLVASNNLKYEVDVDEEYNMPAPADMERLGITSKAGSLAGPPAPPLQQYPPELDKTELAAALEKVPCIRSIKELLPTLSDCKRRRVNVEEFFRIIDQPNPDNVSPDIQLCVMWNLGSTTCSISTRRNHVFGLAPNCWGRLSQPNACFGGICH
jgi:hypothetical protein